MNRDIDSDTTCETRRLLAELDQAISRSGAIRDIARRWERLHAMERVNGPSRKTRVLHKEIMLLEHAVEKAELLKRRIHAAGVDASSAAGSESSPV